jgi:5-methylcytosine-specific restriction endonuclease McrA
VRGWILAPADSLAQPLCHKTASRLQILLDAILHVDFARSVIVPAQAPQWTTHDGRRAATRDPARQKVSDAIEPRVTTTGVDKCACYRRRMTHQSVAQLSDRDLLAETSRLADCCRRRTAELVALLAEVESRKLYRGLGHSSLFTYCTDVLHLSEAAAYVRMTAARIAIRLPVVLRLLADGDVTLTTITLLSRHLTRENHERLLAAARHKSKIQVQRLVASVDPKPDVPPSVRKSPTPAARESPAPENLTAVVPNPSPRAELAQPLMRPPSPAVVAPLAPARYLVKITVSQETHAKLQRARDLLRHSIPNGDPAAIVDRALTALIEQLERSKHAKVQRPKGESRRTAKGRRVPAAIRRAVWTRDEGRCAFVGANGRCKETGFLEFHHVVPFAAGGAATAENLQLRCRSHNAYEAEMYFGRGHGTKLCPDRVRQPRTTS